MKRPAARADSDMGALEARYAKLLDEHEALEWPKLFDPDWRETVLESRDTLLAEVISAVKHFVTEFGPSPETASARWRSPPFLEKARRLLESLQRPGAGATLRSIRPLWLEFALAAHGAGIVSPDPIDRLLNSESARGGGKLSGEKRRAQQNDRLNRAAIALGELQEQSPFKRHTRADIEAKMGMSLPKRITRAAIVKRLRKKAVKK